MFRERIKGMLFGKLRRSGLRGLNFFVLVFVGIIGFYLLRATVANIQYTQISNNSVHSLKSVLAKSDGVMHYIYNAPESSNDTRYEYHWEILRTALEKTKEKYGPYVLEKSELMTEKRQLFELENASGKITVLYLDDKLELEKKLTAVYIPVDRNLTGYRVLLIRKGEQERFNKIQTLEELKKVPIGLGFGWIDVDILKAGQFNVVTGSNYEGLFKMLVNKRFDAFSRSAVEVLDEFEIRKNNLRDLAIEQNLLLYYPLPMYFWFSKTDQGKKLAARAKEGMELMLKDGTYDQIFYKYHGEKTKLLKLKNRRLFKIQNPYLGPETPFNDARLWYDPLK